VGAGSGRSWLLGPTADSSISARIAGNGSGSANVFSAMNAVPASPPACGTWDAGLIRVYRDRYGDLVRLAYLITGRTAVAEEIVQDAFLASHRKCDTVREPYAYVRTAVVNRCYSWGRRTKLERERRPAPPDPAELVADEMWDALGTLNDRQRTAIVLRFYEDLPDDRIAEVLGCRPATVRTSIHRGLKLLRRVIER
jgi:RNA polymerase sigma factor (sigma-70 family)